MEPKEESESHKEQDQMNVDDLHERDPILIAPVGYSEQQVDPMACVKKASSVKQIDTRCSPSRFYNIISELSEVQKAIVVEIGFGSLLHLKCKTLRRSLCKWLLDHFDVELSSIRIGEKNIPITPMAVQRIMGLQAYGDEMPIKTLEDEELSRMRDRYQASKEKRIELAVLETMLKDKSNVGEDFKRDFVLHAIASILCPTSANGPSKKYLKCVSNTAAIPRLNWAKIVCDCLNDEAISYKQGESTKKYMGGSLLFLQLLFCEYVVQGCSGSWMPKEGPAIQYWTDKEIDKIEKSLGKNYIRSAVYICSERDFAKNRPISDRDCDAIEELTERVINIEDKVDIIMNKVNVIEDMLMVLLDRTSHLRK